MHADPHILGDRSTRVLRIDAMGSMGVLDAMAAADLLPERVRSQHSRHVHGREHFWDTVWWMAWRQGFGALS